MMNVLLLLALAQDPPLVFRDVGDEAGLFPHVAGIRGHAAGWGDVDGDGWPDLYVAAFHTEGSKPNMLFRNSNGKFRLDEQQALRISGRPTAALFADLDNDGDLDLYVSNMPADKDSKTARSAGHELLPCTLFRNEGNGRFTKISSGNGACPAAFGGRSAAVLDFDGDGLLDLLVGEEPTVGYSGSPTKSSRLFRNKGGLQFEDASAAARLTPGIPALGVAAGDLNGDGWPDFFLANNDVGNRLFLNDGKGRFLEAPGSRETFALPKGSPADAYTFAGVAFGDVDLDGRPDIVLGQHYKTPWIQPVPVRLYLNRGAGRFEDVTAAAGLTPLSMKGPHVEVQDFDNDGRPDIYVSIVKFSNGQPHPVIFRNQGMRDGIPRFRADALGVNDFPTAEDRSVSGTGKFFDKMIKEGKIVYMAPGPSADYDNDGRLDLFLANWWMESRSLLLRNETRAGNWLVVQVQGGEGVNRNGIGTVVRATCAGNAPLRQEIGAGYGYASTQEAQAHFGLGTASECDLEIVLPHGKGTITRKGVKANQRIRVP